jgi:hypothetical protein
MTVWLPLMNRHLYTRPGLIARLEFRFCPDLNDHIGPGRLNLPDPDACSGAVTVQRPTILFALPVDECDDGAILHPDSGHFLLVKALFTWAKRSNFF